MASPQGFAPASPKPVPVILDPLNKLTQWLGLGVIFLQFSALPQIQSLLLNVNLHLMYLVGVPALVGIVLSGGVGRTFRGRPAYYWMGFACWMLIATPFSNWPGGSASFCFDYWKTSVIMLFIFAGVIFEWGDVKKAMNVLAASAVVVMICSRALRSDAGDRFGVSIWSIGNPNDYAGHLLLVLPFLAWVLLTGKPFRRVLALLGVCAGLYLILSTASRGALVALGFDAIFFVILGTGRQKAAAILLGPIAAIVLLAVVPSTSLRRMSVVWSGAAESAEADEARASSMARAYTLRTSIRYTLEHPIFGVGPQQFAGYEGGRERIIGTHGYWHETHNSYTQAASECGLPGFLFFCGGIVSTFILLYKTFRQAKRRPDCQDIRVTVFCIVLGMVGFTVAITFLNFAYYFYLPAMAGLAIGVHTAANREFQLRDAALQAGAA